MGEINATSVTLQAVLFSLLSTAIAQLLSAWKEEGYTFELSPYLTFVTIAVVTAPPNYFYQKWLEDSFPARIPNERQSSTGLSKDGASDQLSKVNTITKFLCDQTLGASVNTAAFIVLARLSSGGTLQQARADVYHDFLNLLWAGWRFWPIITLLNLCVVPWEWRPAVGNTAGLCWGTYMSIREMMK